MLAKQYYPYKQISQHLLRRTTCKFIVIQYRTSVLCFIYNQNTMRISIDMSVSKKMPFFSYVPAWYPFTSVDVNKKEIDINRFLVPHPTSTFLVRVKGDSMILKGIVDGDYVIVDRSVMNPEEHDIVVASVDGESNFTIKTFRKNENRVSYLEPANPDFENIYPKQSLEILGRVVGVFRRVH